MPLLRGKSDYVICSLLRLTHLIVLHDSVAYFLVAEILEKAVRPNNQSAVIWLQSDIHDIWLRRDTILMQFGVPDRAGHGKAGEIHLW